MDGASRQRWLIGVAAALVLACAVASGAGAARPVCPSRGDACVDRLLRSMARNTDRLGCGHNGAFALLYWRTTEGMRDAIRAGEFSDRPFWNQITTAFGRYYLDAFAAWRRGHFRRAPKAWRIAFRAAQRKQVSTAGDLFLGINAHVNRDLAFVYHRLRVRDHDDHLHVNDVLARVQASVSLEILTTLDPALATELPADTSLSLDIAAWRELAWRNARRLDAAPDAAARRAIAAGIDRHAVVMARRIRAAFPVTPGATRARDAFCREHRG